MVRLIRHPASMRRGLASKTARRATSRWFLATAHDRRAPCVREGCARGGHRQDDGHTPRRPRERSQARRTLIPSKNRTVRKGRRYRYRLTAQLAGDVVKRRSCVRSDGANRCEADNDNERQHDGVLNSGRAVLGTGEVAKSIYDGAHNAVRGIKGYQPLNATLLCSRRPTS